MLRIKKNIKLAPYTTYKIGGPAKYFIEAKTKEEVLEALEYAEKNSLKHFILSGGSNVLFSDEGFEGLVIKLCLDDIKLMADDKIYSESGVKLTRLVQFSLENDLTGLEFLAGIPGEVGGAVRGNAGAFGGEIKDFIEKIEVIRGGKIVSISNKEAEFGYRDSLFKHNNDVILSVVIKAQKGDINEAKERSREYMEYRKENHPWEPSAGSTFKNIKEKRIAVGKLIEECGLKGRREGGAQISEKHANFIINLGEAKASDVRRLIELVKEKVKEKHGIELEEEIRIIDY